MEIHLKAGALQLMKITRKVAIQMKDMAIHLPTKAAIQKKDTEIHLTCSSGFYGGIESSFIRGLLYLQGFMNVLHQYCTALSGIRSKQSRLCFEDLFKRRDTVESRNFILLQPNLNFSLSVNLIEDPAAIFLQIKIHFLLFFILAQA